MLHGRGQFTQSGSISPVEFVHRKQESGSVVGQVVGERGQLRAEVWVVFGGWGLPGKAAEMERQCDRGHPPPGRRNFQGRRPLVVTDGG